MGKKDKKEQEKPKKKNFKAFLKKRAPLYLAGIALIVISANGVLSEKHLDDFLIDLSEEEQIVVDILMQYNGPNESGLNVKDAIENKINDEYPNMKIFDDRNNLNESVPYSSIKSRGFITLPLVLLILSPFLSLIKL